MGRPTLAHPNACRDVRAYGITQREGAGDPRPVAPPSHGTMAMQLRFFATARQEGAAGRDVDAGRRTPNQRVAAEPAR